MQTALQVDRSAAISIALQVSVLASLFCDVEKALFCSVKAVPRNAP